MKKWLRASPTFAREKWFWKQGVDAVAGIDEVGRGCLAGPVVAAATIFEEGHRRISGVNDSKKLTSTQRELLCPKIQKCAKFFGVGLASVEEINRIGINPAIFLAMERALLQLHLPVLQVILVDGKVKPKFHQIESDTIETIIKGDGLSYSIAAASIIAKVYRDKLMRELSLHFPVYGWDKNVGYATKEHRLGIKQQGLCEHHRSLFCRKVMEEAENLEE